MSSQRRYRLLALLVTVLVGLSLAARCTTIRDLVSGPKLAPTVVLISIDGFRWDYLARHDAPTLQRLAEEGVWADQGMTPVFPTKTFPNHYSIVTGLYPEHHGIVGNTMYDPGWDDWFSLSNRDALRDARWWEGEPLWVTAERQGQISATYFWPGSEAPIQGTRPTYWLPYDGQVPGGERVAQVLAWLDLPPAERPTFITLYFSEVDGQGHTYGPDAPETAQAIRNVDGFIGQLVDGLQVRNLYDQVNLILVSDHGMAPTSGDRVIVLDDYINLDDVLLVDSSPVLALRPKPGRTEAVYTALKDANPHLTVYRKEDLPARLHFAAHHRIAPIIGLLDEGWSYVRRRSDLATAQQRMNGATHGYDNALPSMRALFIARGPAFRSGLTVAPFESVHLYGLMAALLGLQPAPHDGDLRAVEALLTPAAVSTVPD